MLCVSTVIILFVMGVIIIPRDAVQTDTMPVTAAIMLSAPYAAGKSARMTANTVRVSATQSHKLCRIDLLLYLRKNLLLLYSVVKCLHTTTVVRTIE